MSDLRPGYPVPVMPVLENPAFGLLQAAPPIFFVPDDDVLPVLSAAIGGAERLDCMMGFFSSSSFAQIAPGLAAFLRRSSEPMRLLISPYVTPADQEAMREGALEMGELASRLFPAFEPDANALVQHTLSCLAWLIRSGRLQVRVAYMRDGLFHPKVWLLSVGAHRVAFHGSSNMTGAGLAKNKEQIALARAWMDDVQATTERRIRDAFNALWDGDDNSCVVIRLPEAIERRLLRDYGSGPQPDEKDVLKLWYRASGIHPEPEVLADVVGTEGSTAGDQAKFEIPAWLEYRSGPYSHQGAAVDAWIANNGRGILAMATGSGKTLTALAACCELHRQVGRMLIVIAAPYVPLVMQWCDEAEAFGLRPRNLSAGQGPAARRKQINAARRNLQLGLSPAEVLVVSHDILTDPMFLAAVGEVDACRVLIGDEVHNLGSPSFVKSPPELFEYRLGLSATPVRQYDSDGTAKLLAYFGPICFEFTLEEAIGVCLVPYDYYVHPVALTSDEMDTYKDLTEQISRLSWKLEQGIKDAQLDSLLRKRRLVVETAAGKLGRLGELLDAIGARNLRHELIYATDKDPDQLNAVNAMLSARGVLFHQLTAEETGDRRMTADILSGYQAGTLQALTAKRVLDEGVNIPQIRRAFILASTTVERQWVQRRGRILRRCEAIGKDHGVIHDFVALPPKDMLADPDARNLIRGELKRVEEFAAAARNYAAPDGPLAALAAMQSVVHGI